VNNEEIYQVKREGKLGKYISWRYEYEHMLVNLFFQR